MLMRINYNNFLIHAIDYFDRYDFESMGYIIISAKVRNSSQEQKIAALNILYPTVEQQARWRDADYDISVIAEEYVKTVLDTDDAGPVIFSHIIEPVLNRSNVMIICADYEDPLVDLVIEFIRDKYKIEAVDLNQLFETGELNSISVNLNKVHDKVVDVRRMVANMQYESLATTADGRMNIMTKMMSKSDKIEKLRELGCEVSHRDLKSIDTLLIEMWVNAEDVVD